MDDAQTRALLCNYGEEILWFGWWLGTWLYSEAAAGVMPALKPNYTSNTLGSSPLLCRSSFHTFLGLILIPLFSSAPMSCFTEELEY